MSAGRAPQPTAVLSVAFGLLMVAATAIAAEGLSLAAAALAVVVVVVSIRIPAAATLAVLISVVVVLLADTPPMGAALAGLAAAAHLALRHARHLESVATSPTVVGALGLSAVGLGATLIPVSVPWLPLAAPVAVLLGYVIVVQPLLAPRRQPAD